MTHVGHFGAGVTNHHIGVGGPQQRHATNNHLHNQNNSNTNNSNNVVGGGMSLQNHGLVYHQSRNNNHVPHHPNTRSVTSNNGSAFQHRNFSSVGTHVPQVQHVQHQTLGAPSIHHQNLQTFGASGFLRGAVQEADFPLRILVQSDMIGAIIGRSGNTIKQITQQSKARVDVHRDESKDKQKKVISITGAPESCSAACHIILEIILNEKAQNIDKNGSDAELNNSSSAKNDNFNDNDNVQVSDASGAVNEPAQQKHDECQLKILAHNNFIGRLIGRSGASIKKIMESTSTKINVSASNIAEERIITVVGDLEHVKQAEQIISSKLRTAFLSDINNPLQNMNHQPYLFNNVPIPYMSGPYQQNPLISSLVNSHAGHAISRSRMPVGPHSHQNQMTGSPLYPGAPNYLSLYQNIRVPPASHGLLGLNPAASAADLEREIVNLYIPNLMVGAIIGKSGSVIKEMIRNSGASIKVATAPSQAASNTANDENATQQQETNHSDLSVLAQPHDSSNQDEVLSDPQTPAMTSFQQPTPVSRSITALTEPQTPMRKVTIVGTPEAQWSAQYLIYRKISIESKQSDTNLMVEIRVPSQLVGRIIGKGGVTIKLIQKQTGSLIRLPDEKPLSSELENDSETSVQITGEFHSSQLAQRQIRDLIRKGLNSNVRQNNSSRPNQTSNKQDENIDIAAKTTNAQVNFIDNNNHHHRSDNESVSTLDERDNESNKA